ncbi:MAG: phosphoribosylanthranilate isomerase [Synergistaceae bacterium]|nr:phosphoribosylanthranilate isomerase [Synergistaceae bacterium]
MTKIKFCGLSRPCDAVYANEIKPDYVGFVFFERSRRNIPFERAEELKKILKPEIKTVGVFVNDEPEKILRFSKVLDLIQLHGNENEIYIEKLKSLIHKPIIKAFQIKDAREIKTALTSPADYIMFDSGQGTGKNFNWDFIKNFSRAYFLAGGLDADNVAEAIKILNPFAVDVSSGIETDGFKDKIKMSAFAAAVRKES